MKRNYRRYKQPSIHRLQANLSFRETVESQECEVCGYLHHLTVHHIRRVADGGTEEHRLKILLCRNHHAIADVISRANKFISSRREMVSLILGWEAENPSYQANLLRRESSDDSTNTCSP